MIKNNHSIIVYQFIMWCNKFFTLCFIPFCCVNSSSSSTKKL